MKKKVWFIAIILLILIVIVGSTILSEEPVLLYKSTDHVTEKGLPTDLLDIVRQRFSNFTPYYFNALLDEQYVPVYTVCGYVDIGFDSRYLVKELHIQREMIQTKIYIGEAKAFKEQYPNSIISPDPVFYKNVSEITSNIECLSPYNIWTYCDNHFLSISTSDD